MKRYISMLIICVILLLTACGSAKVSNSASDKAISCADKAIETAEEYLDDKINYWEAKEIIDDLKADMKSLEDPSSKDVVYNWDIVISSMITILSADLLFDHDESSDETYSKIQDDIEKLRELIK